MVYIKSDKRKITYFDKYPDYIVDHIDKIIYHLFYSEQNPPPTYTNTAIENHVKTVLIMEASNGLSIKDKLDRLIKCGFLTPKNIETNIKYLTLNKKDDTK